MTINYGDSSASVGWLQTALGVNPNNQFGPITAKALIATPQVQAVITSLLATNGPVTTPPTPGGPINLIDIYHDDDVSSWADVLQAGYVGVIQKASQGLSIDSKFIARYPEALSAGLKTGAYHFPNFGDPTQEADFFVNQLKAVGYTPKRDINPAIDWEYSDGHNPSHADIAFVKTFIAEIKATLGIKRVFIYASDYLFQYLLSIGETFYQSELKWVAKYSSTPPKTPYDIWQKTGNGSVPGLNGGQPQSDVDYFAGSVDELMALMG